MPPMFLLAVMAACEREDQRIVTLKHAERAQITHVIRQYIVGKHTSRHDVRMQRPTPLIKDLRSFTQQSAAALLLLTGARAQR